MSLFKLRLRERVGAHTEAHPTDPELEVVVQPGQVFESKTNWAERWPEKFEVMAEVTPPSRDLFVRRTDGKPLHPAQAPAPRAGGDPAAGLSKAPPTLQNAAAAGTVESMPVEELRRLAEEEGIKIPQAAKTRDQVLAAVKAGLKM